MGEAKIGTAWRTLRVKSVPHTGHALHGEGVAYAPMAVARVARDGSPSGCSANACSASTS